MCNESIIPIKTKTTGAQALSHAAASFVWQTSYMYLESEYSVETKGRTGSDVLNPTFTLILL